jgi:hypothetical protein
MLSLVGSVLSAWITKPFKPAWFLWFTVKNPGLLGFYKS